MLPIIFLLGVMQTQLLELQAELPRIAPESPKIAQVQSTELFEAIALCESGNVATAKNPRSTASGRFQFLKSSWEHYGKQLWGDEWKNKNVFDYKDNTELAWYVFKKNGTRDWLESKSCWSKIASTQVE